MQVFRRPFLLSAYINSRERKRLLENLTGMTERALFLSPFPSFPFQFPLSASKLLFSAFQVTICETLPCGPASNRRNSATEPGSCAASQLR